MYRDWKPHLVPMPAAVSINPFRPLWSRVGHWKIEDWDCLSRLSTRTNGDDLVVSGDIDLGNRHFLPKHLGHERKGEILLDRREEPASLLRFVVGAGGRLLDHTGECCCSRA